MVADGADQQGVVNSCLTDERPLTAHRQTKTFSALSDAAIAGDVRKCIGASLRLQVSGTLADDSICGAAQDGAGRRASVGGVFVSTVTPRVRF